MGRVFPSFLSPARATSHKRYAVSGARLIANLRIGQAWRGCGDLLRRQRTVSGRCEIPVCVGISTTKTLAKVANRTAKKDPLSGGVCYLPDEASQTAALAKMELGRRVGHRPPPGAAPSSPWHHLPAQAPGRQPLPHPRAVQRRPATDGDGATVHPVPGPRRGQPRLQNDMLLMSTPSASSSDPPKQKSPLPWVRPHWGRARDALADDRGAWGPAAA